jgi:hypothetical protein
MPRIRVRDVTGERPGIHVVQPVSMLQPEPVRSRTGAETTPAEARAASHWKSGMNFIKFRPIDSEPLAIRVTADSVTKPGSCT